MGSKCKAVPVAWSESAQSGKRGGGGAVVVVVVDDVGGGGAERELSGKCC